MESGRSQLLVVIGVGLTVILGLAGVGLGVANLNHSSAPQPTVNPTGVIVRPDSGAVVSGTVVLDVTPLNSTNAVTLQASGGDLDNAQIAVAKPTLAGWLAQWDSTKVANATYRVSASVFAPSGQRGQTSSILVTVRN